MKLEELGYLSPSTINLFIRDKSKFIMKIADVDTFDGSPATVRGNAVENAVFSSVVYKHKSIQEFIDEAEAYYWIEIKKLNGEFEDKKIESERKALQDYISVGVPKYQSIDDQLIDTQGKIKLELEGVKVPIVGYYDIAFENHIRDLKTTRSIPSMIPRSTQRQMAIYSQATQKDVWVDYVSRKNYKSSKVTNVKETIEEVTAICQGIEKFLNISNDIQELANIFYPNLDSWEWDKNSINNAKQLWSIK